MDEELLVRLTGEANSYIKMLNDAQAKTSSSGQTISNAMDTTSNRVITGIDKIGEHTNKYAQTVNKASADINRLKNATSDATKESDKFGTQITKVGKNLKEIGQTTLEFGESLKRLTGGFSLQESLKEFQEGERTQRLLTTAIRTNGRAVDETLNSYNEFANEIQKTTSFSGGYVLSLLKQAESLDLTGEAAKRAVRGALALEETQGRAADTVIRATAALEKGSSKAIGEYLPTLRGIKNEAEKVAEAHRLLTNEYAQVEAAVNTSVGATKQLTNQWNDFKQTMGEAINTVLRPLTSVLQEVISLFQELPGWVKAGAAITLTLVAGMATLSVAVGTALAAFGGMKVALAGYVTGAKLATAATLGIKAAIIAGLVYAVYEGIRALSGANTALENLNKNLEESQRLNEKWAERFTKGTGEILKGIEEINDPAKKRSAIETQLKTAQKELQGYKNLVESSTKQYDEMNTRWNRWTATSAVNATNKELEDHKRKLELARTRIEQLNNAYKSIRPIEFDRKVIEQVEKFNEKLRNQVDTLGMASEEAEIYKLKLLGVERNTLAVSVALSEMYVNLKKAQAIVSKANEEFDKITQRTFELDFQLRGLTDAEKSLSELDRQTITVKHRLRELKETAKNTEFLDINQVINQITVLEKKLTDIRSKEVFTDEDVVQARKLSAQLEAMMHVKLTREEIEKLEKGLKEIARVSEDISLKGIEVQELQRANELMEKGRKITQQYIDPFKKWRNEVTDLQILLGNGAISQEVFNSTIKDTNESLTDTIFKLEKAKEAVQSFNHVKFGSAEAEDRIQEFNDKLSEQLRIMRKIEEGKRNAGVEKLGVIQRNIEEAAQGRLRDAIERRNRAEEGKTFPIPIPNATKGIESPIPLNAQSVSDTTAVSDRKEMIKFLSSIDGTLKNISGKPGLTLGTVNIQNTNT